MDPARRTGPGRPRRPEVDARIRAAALELLHEGGPDAVTVEAVTSRSGVAKTTVYRRYDDSRAVLRGALEAAVSVPGDPPGGGPRAKIRWALGLAWHQMDEVLGPGGLAAVLGDTHPGFTDLFRRVLDPYAAVLVDLVRADVGAGELRADLDADMVVSVLLGAALGELLRHGRVRAGFTDACVDLLWAGMRRP